MVNSKSRQQESGNKQGKTDMVQREMIKKRVGVYSIDKIASAI